MYKGGKIGRNSKDQIITEMNQHNETTLLPDHSIDDDEILTKTRQELIHRYESIVYDYLAIMNVSETLKTLECQKYAIQLGLSAITHIYKLAFCLTRNVSTSADHCQKGIYCFIEYIEQTCKLGYINPNGAQSPFDFMDAIVFIYDKTLSDLRVDGTGLGEQSSGSSAFSNILSVSQSHQAQGDDFLQCKSALERFGRVVSVLLWFTHPTFGLADHMNIVDLHLIDFLNYTVDYLPNNVTSLDNDLFLFLETVQENIHMDKTEYMDLLSALKKQMKKHVKRDTLSLSVLPACLYVKTFAGSSLKDVVEQEKWKSGSNDLAKIIFR